MAHSEEFMSYHDGLPQEDLKTVEDLVANYGAKALVLSVSEVLGMLAEDAEDVIGDRDEAEKARNMRREQKSIYKFAERRLEDY